MPTLRDYQRYARRGRPRNQRVLASTTARGYGSAHQKLAAILLAAWQPGDPCTRCGQPMWLRWTLTPTGRRVSAIHLDHADDRMTYRGLSHAYCNTAAANRQRHQPARQPSRAW